MNIELQKTILLQQNASNPRNCAWVFASAGSGKTKVLTDRVLRLLLDGVKSEKILCLTFTKVAAAEMQERINKRLGSWAIISEEKLQEEIAQIQGRKASENEMKKARVLFATILDPASEIKIQTIHSFCQNLVKIFPFENNVRPNFEVTDANSEKLLLARAKKEVFLEAFRDEILKNAIGKINARLSEDSFDELVGKILSQKEKLIFLKEELGGIENIITQIFNNFATDINQNEENIFADFLKSLDLLELEKLVCELENHKMKTNQKTAFLLKKFIKNPKTENFFYFKKVFYTKEDELKKSASVVTKDFAHHYDFIENLQNKIVQYLEILNSYKIASSTALLLRFIDKILEKYAQLKAQNSLLDYNDLIIKTENMLKNPDHADWIKFRMDGFFDHILIDESQDTNHRQWSIIKALTEDFFSGQSAQNQNRTIFIIGDDKQSIYSFQGSEPNISRDIFSYYSNKLSDGPFKLNKIDLQNSFRSLPKILHAVDAIFADKNLMGNVEYQAHRAIRQGVGKIEIWPQIKLQKTTNEKDFTWKIAANQDEDYAAKEFLAEFIARKIAFWIQNGRKIESTQMPVKYGDIMILLRNRANNFDEILQKYLQKYDIPFKGAKKTSFAKELLIQDLLACAKFVLLPDDDLNLACLLKSPFFALSEDELLQIAQEKNRSETNLFIALQSMKSSFLEVYEKLQNLISDYKIANCYEFYSKLLNTQNRKKFIAEFGEEASEIMDQFMIILGDFCQNNLPNLQKFVEFAQNLDPQFSLSQSNENQVMITTIHSAKGLQAPIVIIPDCSFNFNQTMSFKENFFWIDFNTIELPIWCARKSEENILLKAWKKHKNQLTKEEYSRLLYVALTRAEDELYLGAFGATKSEDSWYEIVRNALQNQAQMLDFTDSLTAPEKEFFEKKLEKFLIDDKILCL